MASMDNSQARSVSLAELSAENRRALRAERLVVALLYGAAMTSIATTFGIVGVLLFESAGFFDEVGILEFFAGTKWTPLFEPRSFGVLPILLGTLFVAGGALLVSVPCGVAIALFLSEFASDRLRRAVKPVLELLAGIPSIVFGYFAVTLITPILRTILPETQVFNAASAAIVVGFMTLPMVASLSDDALRSVPRSLKEAGLALGATRFEVIRGILLPAAASGIIASFILAFSRAIGETMAVTLAAGATPRITLNPLESIQTMTAYIVQVSLGDTPHGTIEYQSLFVVGLLLFAITLVMNILAQVVVKKLRRTV